MEKMEKRIITELAKSPEANFISLDTNRLIYYIPRSIIPCWEALANEDNSLLLLFAKPSI